MQLQLSLGEPVISVDTKKKELVGPFKNGGRELRPKGAPEQVLVHDFLIPDLGRVSPYGVYDIAQNEAWVTCGDGPRYGCFCRREHPRWWRHGAGALPEATRLLITADRAAAMGIGSVWKLELQKLADARRVPSHQGPASGTRSNTACSPRCQNWRGKPLVSHEVVVNLIGATTTRTGLRVQSQLDRPGR